MKARTLAEIDRDAAASEIVPQLIDKGHIAKLLQVSTRQLDRLVHIGEFPKPIVVGARRRWRASDYNAYVARLLDQKTKRARRG